MYGNKEPRVSKINKLLFSFSLQTILPIAVFGGLGLGALAYWDSITRYTNLCKKVSYLLLKLDISLTYLWPQAYNRGPKNMKISQNFTKKKKSISKYALVTTISYS